MKIGLLTRVICMQKWIIMGTTQKEKKQSLEKIEKINIVGVKEYGLFLSYTSIINVSFGTGTALCCMRPLSQSFNLCP